LIRHHLGTSLTVNVEEAHDLKLALDVSAQDLITKMLLKQFPDHAVIGEEGSIGSLPQRARFHWLVAPRSTVIQTSEVHSGVSDDPKAALESLFEKLVQR